MYHFLVKCDFRRANETVTTNYLASAGFIYFILALTQSALTNEWTMMTTTSTTIHPMSRKNYFHQNDYYFINIMSIAASPLGGRMRSKGDDNAQHTIHRSKMTSLGSKYMGKSKKTFISHLTETIHRVIDFSLWICIDITIIGFYAQLMIWFTWRGRIGSYVIRNVGVQSQRIARSDFIALASAILLSHSFLRTLFGPQLAAVDVIYLTLRAQTQHNAPHTHKSLLFHSNFFYFVFALFYTLYFVLAQRRKV